jgi:cyclopropane fatty-acyl-phospholipid synthase-like methyltransferase
MSYLDQTLTITGSQIYYTQGEETFEVMMDWEDEIMSASAAYVCQNGGDILEIGFGMGISANYIQSHSITSHTICENHSQIIPLALEWAQDKPNVTIITSSWYDVKDTVGTFDGIFYDAFGDDNWVEFSSSLVGMCNPNAVATWFNGTPSADDALDYPGLLYDSYSVSPEPNFYFNYDTYYLPKWQL